MRQSLKFTGNSKSAWSGCLKTELKKAIWNKSAIVSYILVLCLVLCHGIRTVGLYENLYAHWQSGKIQGNPMITSMSLFCRWLGADVTSFECNLFYFLFPILVALPYGGSLIKELQTGYTKNVLLKLRT